MPGHLPGNPSRPAARPPQRQIAGFSVFVDIVESESERARRESRLYHAESGTEITIQGADPEMWTAWLAERIPPEENPRGEPVDRIRIDVVEVEIRDRPPREGDLVVADVHAVVTLQGMDAVERALGARILAHLLDRSGRHGSGPQTDPHSGTTPEDSSA